MKLLRTYALTFGILLCLFSLIASMGQGLSSVPVSLSNNGVIDYDSEPGHYHNLGFESPDDTRFPSPVGLNTKEQTYAFQSEHSHYTTSFSANIVDRVIPPSSVGVRPGSSGSYVLREYLSNPSTENTRRIHIRHLWNPLTAYDIWMDGWVYVPADFPTGGSSWNEFWALLSEREWNPSYVDDFAIKLSLYPGKTNADGTTRIITKINDWSKTSQLYHTYTERTLYSKANSVLIGSWNHVISHVYRPVDAPDPTTADAGGYIEVWIANSKTGWQLKAQDWYELTPSSGAHWGTKVYSRTVGEKPEVLATFQASGDSIKGWLDSGPDLYCEITSSSRYLYFDDLILSDEVTLSLQLNQSASVVNETLQSATTPSIATSKIYEMKRVHVSYALT